MNTKTVICGYLPTTNSCRYHPVQNIMLCPSQGWSRAEIIYIKDGVSNNIFTIGNILNKNFNIIMSDTNDNKILLLVNNKILMEDKFLFYVEIKIYLNSEDVSTDFIKYIEDTINE